MKLWLDAQLSPVLCRWLAEAFDVDAAHVREFGLHEAEDHDLFDAARAASIDAVVTKDRDSSILLSGLVRRPR